jgi:hypothetical protein
MLTVEVVAIHQNSLEHHVAQGTAWLAASSQGKNTAAISYAALELRFAIERIAIHYWAVLLGRKPEEKDMTDIDSFKKIENRIYQLAGHQREINGHFEFMRVVLKAMAIDASFITPNIGTLSRYWHDCSELCHVGWPLASSVEQVQANAFRGLSEVAQSLSLQVASLGWPSLTDPGFQRLRDQFVAGALSADQVVSELKKAGVWARAEFPDGRMEFIGQPIEKTETNPETP